MPDIVKATPKNFITYKNSKITATPILFLTYDKSNEIKVSYTIDTQRNVEKNTELHVDTKRNVEKSVTLLIDTKREITDKPLIKISFAIDTCREVERKVSLAVDTQRNVEKNTELHVDTKRNVEKSVTLLIDTKRTVEVGREIKVSFAIDIRREIEKSVTIQIDTARKIPHIISPDKCSGLKSITITLTAKTLSDTLSIETVQPIEIGEPIQGKLLDFNYNFLVEEITQSGIVSTVNGMYDVDLMLYTPFCYAATKENTAVNHAERIADGLGKKLNIAIDDFTPSSDFSGSGATYKNIISSLFGWTSELPQRQVNVFMRGNMFYVVQRGKEPDSIDITNTKHTRPTINKKIIRSVWSGNSEDNASSMAHGVNISPVPFSGTIEFGDQSATYSAGLVVSEQHGEEHTAYIYNNEYLIKKTTTSPDSTITTTYDYATTKKDKFLAVEKEINIDKDGNKSERITRHIAIGQGWFGTTVEEDGEHTGSSLGQSKTGGKASKYCKDASNLSLGSGYSSGGNGGINGASLINTSFPVEDKETLQELTKAIEWLNKKIEERISMDIYHLNSVIDFTMQIIYKGNKYYLENNAIQRTPRTLKQSITIVRWY